MHRSTSLYIYCQFRKGLPSCQILLNFPTQPRLSYCFLHPNNQGRACLVEVGNGGGQWGVIIRQIWLNAATCCVSPPPHISGRLQCAWWFTEWRGFFSRLVDEYQDIFHNVLYLDEVLFHTYSEYTVSFRSLDKTKYLLRMQHNNIISRKASFKITKSLLKLQYMM